MSKNQLSAFKILSTFSLLTLIGNIFLGTGGLITPKKAFSSPGFFEYQWDQDSSYKRLRYLQSSGERLARSTYFLFLRPKERNGGIINLTIKVPDYFDAKLTPKKFSLCKVKIGGYTNRTKCLKDIPAIFKVNENQTSIEVLPQQPIPASRDSYAIVMKIFNPRKRGMYQLQAFSQSSGELPISLYIGTWNIDIQ